VSSLTGRVTRPRPSRGHDVPRMECRSCGPRSSFWKFRIFSQRLSSDRTVRIGKTNRATPSFHWRQSGQGTGVECGNGQGNCRACELLFRDNMFLARRQGMVEVRLRACATASGFRSPARVHRVQCYPEFPAWGSLEGMGMGADTDYSL
jgi:hypothetical protein